MIEELLGKLEAVGFGINYRSFASRQLAEGASEAALAESLQLLLRFAKEAAEANDELARLNGWQG